MVRARAEKDSGNGRGVTQLGPTQGKGVGKGGAGKGSGGKGFGGYGKGGQAAETGRGGGQTQTRAALVAAIERGMASGDTDRLVQEVRRAHTGC
jgi:hypothetical protein